MRQVRLAIQKEAMELRLGIDYRVWQFRRAFLTERRKLLVRDVTRMLIQTTSSI